MPIFCPGFGVAKPSYQVEEDLSQSSTKRKQKQYILRGKGTRIQKRVRFLKSVSEATDSSLITLASSRPTFKRQLLPLLAASLLGRLGRLRAAARSAAGHRAARRRAGAALRRAGDVPGEG